MKTFGSVRAWVQEHHPNAEPFDQETAVQLITWAFRDGGNDGDESRAVLAHLSRVDSPRNTIVRTWLEAHS